MPDLSPKKTVSISNQSERRERDLQELFRKAKKPVALFVDDAHDLHPKTLRVANAPMIAIIHR
jgi:type II secretory pathway predicted ATPase ExeA